MTPINEGSISFGPSNKIDTHESQETSETQELNHHKRVFDAAKEVGNTQPNQLIRAQNNTQSSIDGVLNGINKPTMTTGDVESIKVALNELGDGIINLFQIKDLLIQNKLTSIMSSVGAKGPLYKSGNFVYMQGNSGRKVFSLNTGTFV